MISMDEVAKHDSLDKGLWVVIGGKVYECVPNADGSRANRRDTSTDASSEQCHGFRRPASGRSQHYHQECGQRCDVGCAFQFLSKCRDAYSVPTCREIYQPVHPPTAIDDNLEENQKLGPVDPKTVKVEQRELTDAEKRRRDALANLPAVGTMLNLDDFEVRRWHSESELGS